MPRDITLKLDDRGAALRDGLYRALEQAVLACLDNSPAGKLVVDVGAGRGELLRILNAQDIQCIGIDIEQECVDLASEHGKCVRGGVDDLDVILGGERPHTIVCSHVLEHLSSPMDALHKMRETDAEWLVLAVPNLHRSARLMRALFGSRRPDHPEHVYGWGHAEFETFVQRAGFVPVRWFVDRVTINPMSRGIGKMLTTLLKPVEEKVLSRLHPTLASSLILLCRRVPEK